MDNAEWWLAYDGSDWVVHCLPDAQNQVQPGFSHPSPAAVSSQASTTRLLTRSPAVSSSQAGTRLRPPDPSANRLPCEETTQLWSVRDGANWVAQPTLRCRVAESVPPSLEDSLAGLLARLQVEAGGPLLTGRGASMVHIVLRKPGAAAATTLPTREELKSQLQLDGGVARLERALRESGVLSLTHLDRLDTPTVTRASGLSDDAAAELKVDAPF